MAEQQTPVVFLHAVERRYHQGDAHWKSPRAELVWPGQSVAPGASGAATDVAAHRRSWTPRRGEVISTALRRRGL
jgi:hypothetical protein